MLDESKSNSAQIRATVEDRAAKPAGLLPKNTQQMVILGVAVVMVLILWLAGGTKRANTQTPPSTAVEGPNAATVEEFKHAIQQQQATTRQPISTGNFERLKALGLAGDVSPNSPLPVPPDTGVPEPGGVLGRSAGSATNQPDPLKEDRKKREYLALFAPNIAFTSRKDAEAPHSQQESQPQKEVKSPPEPKQLTVEPDAQRAGKRYVVFEGTILETLLINRLDGSFAGPVNCLLTTDIYSHDRQHLLIPAGTKVLGETKRVEALGQQRLAVLFHRLIMPDGYAASLDQFKGLSQSGETALRDKVNNHYLQIFGVSLAIGILGGVAQVGTGNALTNSSTDRMREGFGVSMANSSINILDRFLNILPTITIREGSRVKIYFSGDLLLPDYVEHKEQPNL